jgi:hypothetical protein
MVGDNVGEGDGAVVQAASRRVRAKLGREEKKALSDYGLFEKQYSLKEVLFVI